MDFKKGRQYEQTSDCSSRYASIIRAVNFDIQQGSRIWILIEVVPTDTLDLQDQSAPSAKDHTTQNLHPASEEGGIAPHQQLSIRHADQDSRSEITHGPIDEAIGYGDGIDMYDDDDDDLDEHGHGMGGGSSEDGDLTDGEGDDPLEDDMDKISSSPSIDDGMYILSPYWLDWIVDLLRSVILRCCHVFENQD